MLFSEDSLHVYVCPCFGTGRSVLKLVDLGICNGFFWYVCVYTCHHVTIANFHSSNSQYMFN